MFKWIQNIIGTGTLKIKDPEEIKRIRLSNLIALTVFVTGTPFAVVFYLYGSEISGIALVFYILSFLIILQLNRKQRFQVARVVMIILLNTAVIHYSFWYGQTVGLHKMLIPFACVPFLISDRKHGWWIVLSCSISIVGYLIIDLIPFTPLIVLDKISEGVIYYGITAIFWIWLILEMLYLSNQNLEAIKSLNRQRKDQTTAIVIAQEQERKRVARDLHDSLGQLLSALKVNLERYPNKEHQAISNSILIIDQSVEEMRNVAFHLMPNTLENNGLIPALEELAERINETGSFKFFYHVHDIDQALISKDHQYNIYRIIQEGLNNIIKHARAKEVSLQLVKVDNTLTMTIEDDGIGFDVNNGERSGRGLQNIAARTEWLDGDFDIDSGPEIGTTLIVVIPLRHLQETRPT